MTQPVEVTTVGRRWAVMLAAPLLALAPVAVFGGSTASAHDGEFHCTRTAPKVGHVDSDKDALCDDEEPAFGTSPTDPDSDDDGLIDGKEVVFLRTNPLDADTDDDGLSDGDEINRYRTDPKSADSDRDGLGDFDEVTTHKTDPNDPDTDGDLFSDKSEVNNGSEPNDPTSIPFKVVDVEAPKPLNNLPVDEVPVTDEVDPIF